jgi:2-polyprenyl-3-methyl-5-hydroxy-6-metoxy-1,4-benzoquinol methylase
MLGEGYLSRRLAHDGARVIGIDACADLIRSAQESAARNGLSVDYYTGKVDSLPVANDECDVVVCNHLLNDLSDIAAPIREFARVIRMGGRLVILMLRHVFTGRMRNVLS